MTDSVELKGVLEAALSEDGGIILIRNAMAEYQSHKKVHAAVISEVHPCDEHGNFMIDITNPLYDGITIPYMVTPDMVARFTPGVGDYIVLYENDYVSFSPKDVFEGGYLMIEWPSVCASEEDAEMEREIQTIGLTAPRVTPQRIEEVIASEFYFTAADGVAGAAAACTLHCRHADVDTTKDIAPPPPYQSHRLLTFCVITLKNGFTVTGESARASPENFDAELGRKIARDNAINKVWMLEGYLLKQRLHDENP